MITNNWFIVILFLAIATLLSMGYGWTVKEEKLPFQSVMNFTESQWQFIRIWVKIALVLGVILPSIFLVKFWPQYLARQFWGIYLLIVAIQLICEVSFSNYFVKSVVVPIGTIYTVFRLWQLIIALQSLSFSPLWLALFLIVVLFWSANLIMLLFMAIPSILPDKQS